MNEFERKWLNTGTKIGAKVCFPCIQTQYRICLGPEGFFPSKTGMSIASE